MALLRAFHGRMEEEVFRYGGCLEKFIGDALLATFGVPDTGTRDATDALSCARGMLAALDAWNAERASSGLRPMRMGLGLHYGPVVAGDIGSRRSMAFATVGDTTNVTSRLQALTRDLGATIVASGALVAAVEREGADVALLRGSHGARPAPTARARRADRSLDSLTTWKETRRQERQPPHPGPLPLRGRGDRRGIKLERREGSSRKAAPEDRTRGVLPVR